MAGHVEVFKQYEVVKSRNLPGVGRDISLFLLMLPVLYFRPNVSTVRECAYTYERDLSIMGNLVIFVINIINLQTITWP